MSSALYLRKPLLLHPLLLLDRAASASSGSHRSHQRRLFSTTTSDRVRSRGGGFRGHHRVGRGDRQGTGLLDKFVKHMRYDGALVVKAPFDIKVCGSFFDSDNKVDRSKNRLAIDELRRMQKEEDGMPFSVPSDGSLEREDIENYLEHNQEELQKRINSVASMTDAEEESARAWANNTSPMHMLLYGRRYCRSGSISFITDLSHQSHIYVTDSNTFEDSEPEQMFLHYSSAKQNYEPVATASVWQPKPGLGRTNPFEFNVEETLGHGSLSRDELVAGFKMYIPSHLVDPPDNGFKAVFLAPTIMNKIFLQGERSCNVELDGHLINELCNVGIYTETGDIRLKNICAYEVKLASRFGDIHVDSPLNGHNVLETGGDGDLFIRGSADGSSLSCTTEDGDIEVIGECNAQVNKFYTRNGHVHARFLYNQTLVAVKESGTLTLNVVEGCLTASMVSGAAFINIEHLTSDSSISIIDGHLTVTVPRRRGFSIVASAPTTDIASRLMNSGDVFLNPRTGHETFTAAASMRQSGSKVLNDAFAGGRQQQHYPSKSRVPPVLNIIADKGSVTIELAAVSSGAAASNAAEDEFDI